MRALSSTAASDGLSSRRGGNNALRLNGRVVQISSFPSAVCPDVEPVLSLPPLSSVSEASPVVLGASCVPQLAHWGQ